MPTADLTWQEVDEFGVEIWHLQEGDKFLNVIASKDCQTFENAIGRVIHKSSWSVTVLFVRSGSVEQTVWSLDAKVIPIPNENSTERENLV